MFLLLWYQSISNIYRKFWFDYKYRSQSTLNQTNPILRVLKGLISILGHDIKSILGCFLFFIKILVLWGIFHLHTNSLQQLKALHPQLNI